MAGALLFSCSKDKTDDTGKPGKPVIVVTETQGLSLTAEAGSAELHYTVENATEEGVVGAECPASWIELTNSDEPGVIRFNYAANLEADSRSAVITLTYPGAENVAVNVTQLRTEKWVIDLDVQVVDAFNADISIVSTEKEMSYVMLNLTKEDFARFASDNELTAYYLDLFRSVADSYGISLGSLLSQLLYTGDINGKLNNLTPETEYVAIAFGLTTDATVTSEVFSEEYTTPAPPFYSEGIAIDVETLKPNYMNLKLTPGLNDYRYYADVMSQQEVDAYGSLEEFADVIISELQSIINMNNAFGIEMGWDDLTVQGINYTSVITLYSATPYTSFAFGITNGYRTTEVATHVDTTPEPAITNDCTFEFTTFSSDPELTQVRITPSNDSEYFAIISLTSEANSMTPERYADDCIVYANNNDAWMTWKGEQVLEASGLASDTDYTIVVFGVGDYYERNTNVNYYTLHTNSMGKVDITFDLEVTATDQSSVSYFCTPSDLEQTWAVGAVLKEKHDSFASEEEFATYLLTAGNGFPILKSGADGGNLMYDCEWGSIKPGEYLLYAVACYSDGWSYEILSDFTYTPFTIKERTYSNANVKIDLVVYDGDELVAYDPVTFPAADYAGMAAIDIVVTPDASCAEYYICTQNRPAEVMEGMGDSGLVDVIKAWGMNVPGNAQGIYGVSLPWEYNNSCVMGIGVDANGLESRPTVVSLNVSRDQIVPFNPASGSSKKLVPAAFTLPSEAAANAQRVMNGAAQRVQSSGVMPVMKQAVRQAGDTAKTRIVEKYIRKQIEQAGGKYYAPAERKQASEFAKISSFNVR